MKKTIVLMSVGALFASAVAANAVTVVVSDHSFESPADAGTVGSMPDGTGPQPTSGNNPDGWITTEGAGDAVALDSRWVTNWPSNTAGPTDGVQALLLDDRGNGTGRVEQSLGTLDFLGVTGVPLATMLFDARHRQWGNTGGTGDANIAINASILLNGIPLAGGFSTTMDTGMIPTWEDLGSPAAALNNPGSMATFMATGDISAAAGSDILGIRIEMVDTSGGGCCADRVYVDNVRVDAVPEPSALALLGLGLIPLIRRRRR